MNSREAKCFGVLSDGREVTEYTLGNQSGVVVKILNYGGIIRCLEVPDRGGRLADIVLGFDNLSQYESAHPYFGAIIGRVAGRISEGCLPLGDKQYQISVNEPPNHLHGGVVGFEHRFWEADFSTDAQSLRLSYESPAGEEGYPGNLRCNVTYTLTDSNDLIVDFSAVADAPTVVNMTQHSYFNLSGNPEQTIADHTVAVDADRVLELDENAIPTGKEIDVTGSYLDLRVPREIDPKDPGYDNFWVLSSDADNSGLKPAAELRHPQSGRVVQVETTAPGVQIYTFEHVPSGLVGKRGVPYSSRSGICLEAQVHPDSPNRPEFPGIQLGANETYQSTTIFRLRIM